MANDFLNIFAKGNQVDAVKQTDGDNVVVQNEQLAYAARFVDLDKMPLDFERMPQHVAIVMDGNGRWANKRGLPRAVGHRQGLIALEHVVEACSELGIGYLTIYAFSTENWKRPKDEVGTLMRLLVEFAESKLARLCENQVRIRVLGDMAGLPTVCREALERLIENTKNNQGLTMNMAINYGGRWEILEAVKQVAANIQQGVCRLEDIDEAMFGAQMATGTQPDPDLLIRTSGEERISNFLLWQLAYAELYFTDVLWPDFNEKELIQAVFTFQKRDRRFGDVK